MEKKTIQTFKAQSITKDRPVKDTIIEISMPVPDYDTPRDQYTAFWCVAAKLEVALHGSLPGGVYDQVLGKMLARKASRLIVSYGDLEAKETPK